MEDEGEKLLLWPNFEALDKEEDSNYFLDGSCRRLNLTKQTSLCTANGRKSYSTLQGSN